MGEIEQLVRRAKKRDPDAFTELMQLHEKDMYRTASAILPQDADIADAIQETILTVWEKIDTLQKNRYFKTWMIRILINKCKDILRSGRRMICRNRQRRIQWRQRQIWNGRKPCGDWMKNIA